MLLRCIHAEMIKLKRSFIWAVFFILPPIGTVMGCANYMQNLGILKEEWYSLWTQTTLFYSNFFFPPLIAVYCAYLWRLENFNHNRNSLMTSPIPVSCLYGAQFLTIAYITLATQLYVGFLYTVSGSLLGLPGLPPLQIWLWLLRGTLGGLAIAAVQLFLASVLRSFALSIAIGLLAGIMGFLASNLGAGLFFPYSLMLLGMNANRSEDMLSGSALPFYLSCLLFLGAFFFLGIHYLKRADVKA